MSNETIGSLLELLKIALKKAWGSIGFLLLIGVVNAFIIILSGEHSHFLGPNLLSPHTENFLLMLIVNLINIGFAYFAGITIALSKNNSVDGQLRMFGNLFITRGIKLLCSLIAKTIMVLIGLVLLVIPGVYISLRAYTMEFAAVLEDKWPIEAFDKSTEITEGNKWTLLGYLFITLLIGCVIGLLTVGANLLFAMPVETSDSGMSLTSQLFYLAQLCLQFALTVVFVLQICLLYLKRR